MLSAVPLPFDNQAIWQNHTLNFIEYTFAWWLYTTFSLKQDGQIQAIVASTKSKQLYKGVPFPTTAYL